MKRFTSEEVEHFPADMEGFTSVKVEQFSGWLMVLIGGSSTKGEVERFASGCFDNLSRLNLHLLCGNFELKLNDFRRSKSEEINIRENYLVNFLTFKSLENAIFQS